MQHFQSRGCLLLWGLPSPPRGEGGPPSLPRRLPRPAPYPRLRGIARAQVHSQQEEGQIKFKAGYSREQPNSWRVGFYPPKPSSPGSMEFPPFPLITPQSVPGPSRPPQRKQARVQDVAGSRALNLPSCVGSLLVGTPRGIKPETFSSPPLLAEKLRWLRDGVCVWGGGCRDGGRGSDRRGEAWRLSEEAVPPPAHCGADQV